MMMDPAKPLPLATRERHNNLRARGWTEARGTAIADEVNGEFAEISPLFDRDRLNPKWYVRASAAERALRRNCLIAGKGCVNRGRAAVRPLTSGLA
jgi:hypothetical protein